MATDTKTALLDTAEQAARARGFDGFSYADLAEAVGIRKASIHYHFPTKAALSVALMDRYHAMVQNVFATIDEQEETAAARLRALIRFYRAALNDGTTLCLCVSLIGSRESLSDEVMGKIAGFRATVLSWTRSVFEQARSDGTIQAVLDPEDEARATVALLEGAQIAARADADIAVFDQTVALLRSRCEGG